MPSVTFAPAALADLKRLQNFLKNKKSARGKGLGYGDQQRSSEFGGIPRKRSHAQPRQA
jgi:hypothetical protein